MGYLHLIVFVLYNSFKLNFSRGKNIKQLEVCRIKVTDKKPSGFQEVWFLRVRDLWCPEQ